MKLTFLSALLVSAVSAREFLLFEHTNYQGASHLEIQPNGPTCWNLNGKGDRASSVGGDSGCTTFFRERDCRGSSWQQRGSAPTVPSFLNDNIWSFRNQC
ncbi:hypothetical protein QBC34DRAFT_383575 [Podospora aff. communis PSN243]|uniref:Uncharacterized protein n=1 Tax=Podospora aff. communis PSN243 TaxID=3040156 RepID=A0AAV9GDI5_9PEZI|nr:hypothetical protein QBC34DRAFT_383575 [Podospora aff. communis PSN243]